ncbi:kinesin-like protein KIF24 [Acipenser ruthenus]|nr:kinesin-like protein KIF24 [Acipenser ruthenus]XP_034758408.2 kinesin-like protein KIF24 [Acipenser ruthenus]XP_058841820.1 kinesin-like protein KIF24 [Acipenser ruthenus]
MATCLYECLSEAGLQRYYPQFTALGVRRPQQLSRVTMSDYPRLGVHDMQDRTRLFELVQIVKALQGDMSGEGHDPHSPRRATLTRSTPRRQLDFTALPTSEPAEQRGCRPSSSSAYCKTSKQEGRERSPRHTLARGEWHHNRVAGRVEETWAAEEEQVHLERVACSSTSGYNYGVTHSTTRKTSWERGQAESDRIRVCVRKRPLGMREERRGEADVVSTRDSGTVLIQEKKEAVDLTQYILQHVFHFDGVFDDACSNQDVYMKTAYPLIQHVFNGGKATCFAYGQTGAGKTHTMIGTRQNPGLYALAAKDIFLQLEALQPGRHLHVYISFFEIYCGQLYDLLDGKKRLFAREDGNHVVQIVGLREERVARVDTLLEVISWGSKERSTGASGVNADSSRSHAIIQVQIKDSDARVYGRISFIDLAGSERAADARDPDKQTKMEGAEINQSLLALKECIRALDQEHAHTPFRQSKLTQVLKDSFIGNSKTCMIANISPSHIATEHTLNTLRYADRVKELKRGVKHSPGHLHKAGRPVGSPSPKRNKNFCRERNSPKKVKLLGDRGVKQSAQPQPRPTQGLFQPSSVLLCSTPKDEAVTTRGTQRTVKEAWLEQTTPVKGTLRGGRRREDVAELGSGTHAVRRTDSSVKNKYFIKGHYTKVNATAAQKLQGVRPVWKETVTRERSGDQRGWGPQHSDISYAEMYLEQKERERHLRIYHQQLQQLQPSPILQQKLPYQPLESLLALYRAEGMGAEQKQHTNSKSYQRRGLGETVEERRNSSSSQGSLTHVRVGGAERSGASGGDGHSDGSHDSFVFLPSTKPTALRSNADHLENAEQSNSGDEHVFPGRDLRYQEDGYRFVENFEYQGECDREQRYGEDYEFGQSGEREDSDLDDLAFYESWKLEREHWEDQAKDSPIHAEWNTEEDYASYRSCSDNRAEKPYCQEEDHSFPEENLNDLSADQKQINSFVIQAGSEASAVASLPSLQETGSNIPPTGTGLAKSEMGSVMGVVGSASVTGMDNKPDSQPSSETEDLLEMHDSKDSSSGMMAPLTISLLDIERTAASDSVFHCGPLTPDRLLAQGGTSTPKNSREEAPEGLARDPESSLEPSSRSERSWKPESAAPEQQGGQFYLKPGLDTTISSVNGSTQGFVTIDDTFGLEVEPEGLGQGIVLGNKEKPSQNLITSTGSFSKSLLSIPEGSSSRHYQPCAGVCVSGSGETKEQGDVTNKSSGLYTAPPESHYWRAPETTVLTLLSTLQDQSELELHSPGREDLGRSKFDASKNSRASGPAPKGEQDSLEETGSSPAAVEPSRREVLQNTFTQFSYMACAELDSTSPIRPDQRSRPQSPDEETGWRWLSAHTGARHPQQITDQQLEALGKAQRLVVQAHCEEMEEMDTLRQREEALLSQLPGLDFTDYARKLEEIMVQKAKCMRSIRAQLQLYLTYPGAGGP